MKNSEESKEINTEEPERIKNFRVAIKDISWSDDKRIENLEKIFKALIEIAINDLEYYNKQRDKSKNISKLTRGLSLFLATLGAVALILQGIKIVDANTLLTLSSVCFALAAALLTVNRFFVASGSHIRYVMAEFDLGETIVKFTLKWQEWLNRNQELSSEEMEIEMAFNLFREFSKQTYSIIRDETRIWGKSLMDAVDEQYDTLKKKT